MTHAAPSSALAALIAALALAPATPTAGQIHVFGAEPPSGWLGLSYDGRWPGQERAGVTVREVVDDSPADLAGIRVGDVVLSLNGLTATPRLLHTVSRALEPGDTVRLRVRRESEERTLTVTAAEPPESFRRRSGVYTFEPDSLFRYHRRMTLDSVFRIFKHMDLPRVEVLRTDSGAVLLHRFPDGRVDTVTVHPFGPMRFDSARAEALRERFELLGHAPWGDTIRAAWLAPRARGLFRMQVLTGMRAVGGAEFVRVEPELGRYFDVEGGLLVTRVAADTPADRAGLQPGDVIIEADGRAIDDIDTLRHIVADRRGEPLTLTIVRERQRRELRVQLD